MKWIVVTGAGSQFGLEICSRIFKNKELGVWALCSDTTELGALQERFGGNPDLLHEVVDISQPGKVAQVFMGLKGFPVVGLVNTVRFCQPELDVHRTETVWAVNVNGLFLLAQGCRSSAAGYGWLLPFPIVDIADDGDGSDLVHYRAAMAARRQMARELSGLGDNLRIVTIVRVPEDTTGKIAEFVTDALFGMFKDFKGELTPANCRAGL